MASVPASSKPGWHVATTENRGLARWATAVPLRKLAQPGDIVEAALFLAGASHVTGQIISVDGGQTINFVKA